MISRIAALSTMLRTVKRLIALSYFYINFFLLLFITYTKIIIVKSIYIYINEHNKRLIVDNNTLGTQRAQLEHRTGLT